MKKLLLTLSIILSLTGCFSGEPSEEEIKTAMSEGLAEDLLLSGRRKIEILDIIKYSCEEKEHRKNVYSCVLDITMLDGITKKSKKGVIALFTKSKDNKWSVLKK